MKPCPFCNPDPQRVFYQDDLVLALWDAFAVSPGHALVVPRRHVADWWLATPEERQALTEATLAVKRQVEKIHRPDGYNVGVNVGLAGGQTVFHLHMHLIPRYAGDVPQPRGGVRWVIPAKADYVASAGPEPHALQAGISSPEAEAEAQGLEPGVAGTVGDILAHLRLVQARYADQGATDTQPDAIAQLYLARAVGLADKDPWLPVTPEQWHLYEMEGADEAAKELTAALLETERLLKWLLSRDSRGTLAELRERLWRVEA